MKGERIHEAKPEHEVLYQELIALCRRCADNMTPLEILAVAANMVGKIIAMQDQRTTTPEMAMKVVSRNIEVGNAQALAEISSSHGQA